MIERAVARIDLGAVERNCAHIRDAARRRHEALRGRQGERLRPWRHLVREGCARRRRRAGSRSPPRPRPSSFAATGSTAPILVMGALTPDGRPRCARGARRHRRWEPAFAEALAAASEPLGITARVHVKLDTGMGRLGTKDAEQALAVARDRRRGAAPGARRADDALRDGRRAGRRLLPAPARAPSRTSPGASASAIPDVIVHAANSPATFREPGGALRHGALRRRDLRPRPVPGGPGRARARAGAHPRARTSPRSAASSRATAPATAAAGRRPSRPGSARSRSATATAGAARSRTTPRS